MKATLPKVATLISVILMYIVSTTGRKKKMKTIMVAGDIKNTGADEVRIRSHNEGFTTALAL